MISVAKKETPAKGIGERSTGPFFREAASIGALRFLARIKAEVEVSRQSGFPTFMRHQHVRATPGVFGRDGGGRDNAQRAYAIY